METLVMDGGKTWNIVAILIATCSKGLHLECIDGGLPLGLALKQHGLILGNDFFGSV